MRKVLIILFTISAACFAAAEVTVTTPRLRLPHADAPAEQRGDAGRREALDRGAPRDGAACKTACQTVEGEILHRMSSIGDYPNPFVLRRHSAFSSPKATKPDTITVDMTLHAP